MQRCVAPCLTLPLCLIMSDVRCLGASNAHNSFNKTVIFSLAPLRHWVKTSRVTRLVSPSRVYSVSRITFVFWTRATWPAYFVVETDSEWGCCYQSWLREPYLWHPNISKPRGSKRKSKVPSIVAKIKWFSSNYKSKYDLDTRTFGMCKIKVSHSQSIGVRL